MLKSLIFSISLLFLSLNKVYSVDLLQDEKAIICNGFDSTQVSISKSDTVMLVNTKKYLTTDFLDTAILSKSKNDYSFFQATQNNEGYLITGKLFNLSERPDCKTSGFSKICSNESFEKMTWSSTHIKFNEKNSPLNMKVLRYGVYPVDGTYFIAKNENFGAALIDFGAKIKIIVGEFKKVKCGYHQE